MGVGSLHHLSCLLNWMIHVAFIYHVLHISAIQPQSLHVVIFFFLNLRSFIVHADTQRHKPANIIGKFSHSRNKFSIQLAHTHINTEASTEKQSKFTLSSECRDVRTEQKFTSEHRGITFAIVSSKGKYNCVNRKSQYTHRKKRKKKEASVEPTPHEGVKENNHKVTQKGRVVVLSWAEWFQRLRNRVRQVLVK